MIVKALIYYFALNMFLLFSMSIYIWLQKVRGEDWAIFDLYVQEDTNIIIETAIKILVFPAWFPVKVVEDVALEYDWVGDDDIELPEDWEERGKYGRKKWYRENLYKDDHHKGM